MKTASPWMFSPFSIDGAESLMDMEQDAAAGIAAQWLLNTAASLKANYTEPEQETSTEGTEETPAEQAGTEESRDGSEDAAAPSEEAYGEAAAEDTEENGGAEDADMTEEAGDEGVEETDGEAGADETEDMNEEAGSEETGEA